MSCAPDGGVDRHRLMQVSSKGQDTGLPNREWGFESPYLLQRGFFNVPVTSINAPGHRCDGVCGEIPWIDALLKTNAR